MRRSPRTAFLGVPSRRPLTKGPARGRTFGAMRATSRGSFSPSSRAASIPIRHALRRPFRAHQRFDGRARGALDARGVRRPCRDADRDAERGVDARDPALGVVGADLFEDDEGAFRRCAGHRDRPLVAADPGDDCIVGHAAAQGALPSGEHPRRGLGAVGLVQGGQPVEVADRHGYHRAGVCADTRAVRSCSARDVRVDDLDGEKGG